MGGYSAVGKAGQVVPFIKNIPNDSKVMGYPAKDLKKFIKNNK